MNVLARQTRGSGGNRNWQKCVSRRQSTKIFSGEPQTLRNVNKGGFLFMPLPRSPTWSLAYLVTSFNMCTAPTFMQILSPSAGAYH